MTPFPPVDNGGAVRELLDAGKALALSVSEKMELQGQTFVFTKDGGSIRPVNLTASLPAHAQPHPERKTGVFRFHDIESFAAYVNAHKGEGTDIFVAVTEEGARFVAVLNGHGSQAGAGDHRALYELARSIEWKRWMEHDREAMSQVSFCEHLEDCQEFITKPQSADLLKLLQSLEGKVNASFKQVVNLHTGAVKIAYEEDVSVTGKGAPMVGAGEMTIPTEIGIALPPFENVSYYHATARLRLRTESRRLTFQYETLNTHIVTKTAVKGLLEQVEKLTSIKPLLGIPT